MKDILKIIWNRLNNIIMLLGDSFIFVELPKTGTSTIHKTLRESDKINVKNLGRKHNSLGDIKRDLVKKNFVFGGIRNPFDWYVSKWASTTSKGFDTVHPLTKKPFDKFIYDTLTKEHKGNVGSIRWLTFDLMNKFDIGLYSLLFLRIYSEYDRLKIKLDDIPENNSLKYTSKFLLMDKVYDMDYFPYSFFRLFEENLFELDDEIKYKISNRKFNISEHVEPKGYYDNDMIELIKYKDRIIFDFINNSEMVVE